MKEHKHRVLALDVRADVAVLSYLTALGKVPPNGNTVLTGEQMLGLFKVLLDKTLYIISCQN